MTTFRELPPGSYVAAPVVDGRARWLDGIDLMIPDPQWLVVPDQRWTIGGPDSTDGTAGDSCLVASGEFECTRRPHDARSPHATGVGGALVAVWLVAP